MDISGRLFRKLASLKVTIKIGLAISFLLAIIVVEAVIGYGGLHIVLENNKAILASGEMQRLAMSMERNWESVRRLEQGFFVQSALIGPERAYELYALPAGTKISEVIRDGATLQQSITSQDASENLQQSHSDLQFYLATVSQYATTFEEVSGLELQLRTRDTGLLPQLDGKADDLLSLFTANGPSSNLLMAYYDLRSVESEFVKLPTNTSQTDFLSSISNLRYLVENSSMEYNQSIRILTCLDEYASIGENVYLVETQIQEKMDLLNTLDQSIESSLITLLVTVDTEVGINRLKIENTRRLALTIIISSIIFGLLVASVIAVALHRNVTQKIIKLNQVAVQFNAGNFDARAQVESQDEIGQLGMTFNRMAKTVSNFTAELREQAIRDELTGVFNRRYLDTALSMELSKAEQNELPVTLVMLDIDNFKEVNDQYGHAAGDRMLVDLGAMLRTNSRLTDIVCRFGGDEFIIVLVGADLELGVQRAEEWQKEFNILKVPYSGEHVKTYLSLGVVQWTSGESMSYLINRVDEALYIAKNSGRNQIATLG